MQNLLSMKDHLYTVRINKLIAKLISFNVPLYSTQYENTEDSHKTMAIYHLYSYGKAVQQTVSESTVMWVSSGPYISVGKCRGLHYNRLIWKMVMHSKTNLHTVIACTISDLCHIPSHHIYLHICNIYLT